MTVKELYALCKYNTTILVKSAFNGKVLCRRYYPSKHESTVGERIVSSIYTDITVLEGVVGNSAHPRLCVWVEGGKEYDEWAAKQKAKDGDG